MGGYHMHRSADAGRQRRTASEGSAVASRYGAQICVNATQQGSDEFTYIINPNAGEKRSVRRRVEQWRPSSFACGDCGSRPSTASDAFGWPFLQFGGALETIDHSHWEGVVVFK